MNRRITSQLLAVALVCGLALLCVACAGYASQPNARAGSAEAPSTRALPAASQVATPSLAGDITPLPTPSATPPPSVGQSTASEADVRGAAPTVIPGTGAVVARARSSVNGATYEVVCTRIGDAALTSSVAVRQQASTENGVAVVRVVLAANGTEYPVVVNGVVDAAALAALNASLTNVRCAVTP